jgi:predicted  nucleic acid-binding Zn-ribbon protein
LHLTLAMPEPKQHYQRRGVIETMLRHIPGFRGYLEKEYRRDSDRLQREWLADRLQKSKRKLDEVSRQLADQAHLDILPQCDRLRSRLDKFMNRIRGAMRGYSGFFDLVQVNKGMLDRVYEHDVKVMEQVESLAEAIEKLPAEPALLQQAIRDVTTQLSAAEEAWELRVDILKGSE